MHQIGKLWEYTDITIIAIVHCHRCLLGHCVLNVSKNHEFFLIEH